MSKVDKRVRKRGCCNIGILSYSWGDIFSIQGIFSAFGWDICLGNWFIFWQKLCNAKYGGIAIELEDIVDGVYRIENILTGRGLDFRMVILTPKNSRRFYHIADTMKHFPDEAIGVTVEIRNGKIFSYVY